MDIESIWVRRIVVTGTLFENIPLLSASTAETLEDRGTPDLVFLQRGAQVEKTENLKHKTCVIIPNIIQRIINWMNNKLGPISIVEG